MKLAEKISYWLDIAQYDLDTAISMFQSKRYLYTVFMCQQALEKMLKAIFLKQFGKEPPRTHSLVYLESLLELDLTESQNKLLAELTSYYIEGRYPTYKQKLSQLVHEAKAESMLQNTKEVFICLSCRLK